jgi:hypothetical protein
LSNFTITRANLRAVTGWGDQRVRTLLQNPRKLLFVTKPTEKGGRNVEYFSALDIVTRLREKDVPDECITELLAIDAQRRAEGAS